MSKRLGQGVAGAALLIGIVTVLARITGFGRYYVFSQTVQTNCLATAYFTANQVPNLIFEVVVGGALAGAVVPVLAEAAERGDAAGRARASAITSALLSWVLVLLVPLAVLAALLAGPLAGLFTLGGVAGCDLDPLLAAATRMLIVFAPQIPLYGLAVVLYGVLQAHRRFLGPALAPLVSSLVVIVAYLVFVPLSAGVRDPAMVPRPAELALAIGTTLGVAAMVVTVLGPLGRLGLRLRPTLRFPAGVAGRVRRLAAAGLAALLAQQLATAVVLWLANTQGGGGGIAAYNYALAIYQVPYAVLAVPIATSAFPVLSARAERGDRAGFAAMAGQTTRVVILVCGLAAGVLAAAAVPVARVFLAQTATQVGVAEFARAIALFAPGLIGYGLLVHLGRVLYAEGRGRAVAAGTVAGWLVVALAQTALALALPAEWVLGGLGLGSTVGMTAGGALLLAAVGRGEHRAALAGAGRAALAAVLGGAAGFGAGTGVVLLAGETGALASAAVAVAAALAALGAGAAAALAVDRRDLPAVLERIRPRRGEHG